MRSCVFHTVVKIHPLSLSGCLQSSYMAIEKDVYNRQIFSTTLRLH
jgi:hypothetical protein